MRSRSLKSISLFHALILSAALLYAQGGAAADLEQQSSQANNVGISVKPVEVSAKAAT